MPLYEYRCAACDTVFEEQRPMAESDAPATCPAGHAGATRLLSAFAAVGRASVPTTACGTPVDAAPCGEACARAG